MVTFVNRFTVTGDAAEFERVFAQTSQFMQRQPGFLGHRLLRSVRTPGRYVNIARWTDAQALKAATTQDGFEPHVAALRAVSTSDPDLFETVLDRSS